ncbi:uncharacterized protein si:dkey-229b18.3 isoform X2 [Antennarius striatus]|uniref:uncharacterized protein si:dkey-229b18.3 isoform X2 n=1 Tax=Antennarius striatus TaxID=241820 RepID=UPI0035AFA9BD
MADSCTVTSDHLANVETFYPSKPWSDGGEHRAGELESGRGPPAGQAPNFEVIDGLLYRKKLERGFFNYREVLDEDRRQEAISTFHRRMRPGQRHLSLEETYKCVAENYWWEGMYFQIRDFVLGCPECQSQHTKKTEKLGGRGCVTKTMASHCDDVLSKLRSQREAGMFCDITLHTNGRPYLAHKAVLAAVSDHFQEVFTEMDSNKKADVDLTGFSEDSLLSLLDFSYSSTLCVREEDLPEVMAMARHLGMWLAVEACSALIKEQEQQLHHGKNWEGKCHGHCHQQRESRRRADFGLEDTDDCFRLTLDSSNDSIEGSPKRNLRRTSKTQGCNCLPLSPSHRMKLMDFKSPSSKKVAATRQTIGALQTRNYSRMSPTNTRLLRSAPGAALEVQRLFPALETPRRMKKPHSVTRLPCSPVRVKQEVEEVDEDELDYTRAQEKYKLMNVLGLQRTALLPRPEDLIGWRQKKRLRKLKANNYSLTKRRKPRPTSPGLPIGPVTLSLPLCNPVTTRLLSKSVKTKPVGRVGSEPTTKKKRKSVSQHIPPSDRSMRSKVVLPDIFAPSFRGRELRQSVRQGDRSNRVSQQPLRRRSTNKPRVRNPVRIKSEPVEFSVSGLTYPSINYCGHTPPPWEQVRNKVAVDTVKTPRYNSSRPAAKAKLRRVSSSEGAKSKCRPGEVGGKVESQGLGGITDTRQRVKVSEPDEFQFAQQEPPPSIYNHPLYKVIKQEPTDPVPVAAFSDPPSPDRGKRQSKPPIKLLDSGFLFSFCRPAGGPMAVLKKEEESVDICLTRSVSQVGEMSPHRALRARGTPALPVVKREERSVNRSKAHNPQPKSRNNTHPLTKSTGPKARRTMPKQEKLPLSSRSCVMMDATHRARLRQLRGPRSQAPTVPKAAHACLQCSALYKDCDALIMHRLRHVEGKHWPCPLCSKTFFRLRNVRSHIRTHDPKLYKCRSCIVAGS